MKNLLAGILWAVLTICFSRTANAQEPFTLVGTHFTQSNQLPKLYTCDSLGISPALSWKGIPKGTQSFAITMYHIAKDGERHVYMVLYNIPASITAIPDGVNQIGIYGNNSMNKIRGYAPPCSKGPGPKEYIITVSALSEMCSVATSTGMTLTELELWMKSTTLSKAILPVTYSRTAK